MARVLKLRRGTTAQHTTFVGAEGEVTVDTSKKALVVHDGITPGGFPAAGLDIPNLPDAPSVGSNDEFIVQQSGVAKRATFTEVANAFNNSAVATTLTTNSDQLLLTQGGVTKKATIDAVVGPAVQAATVQSTGSTTPRTLANRFADRLNVKDFGAVGDGVANDAPAIRSAFASALSTGKAIYFPSGEYRCASFTTGATSGSGRIVEAINDLLTPKQLTVIGENATVIVPETLTTYSGSSCFWLHVQGYFDAVSINGLRFVHKHVLPTASYVGNYHAVNATNTNNKWPGLLIALGFYSYLDKHQPNIAPTNRVPSNVLINNCSFTDWTQGVAVWYANNVTISDCNFFHTYGQWSAGHDDWTQFVGGRTLGEFRFDRNLTNGFSGSPSDVFAAVPSAQDVRCSDGAFLISGYGPTGFTRCIATNNIVKNFQREGLFFNHNEYNASGVNTVGNLTDKPFYPHIISNNYIDGTCPSGVTAAYNAGIVSTSTSLITNNVVYRCQFGMQIAVRDVLAEQGAHYTRVANNMIVLAEGDQPGNSGGYSSGVSITGPHYVQVEQNIIYGARLGSLNNGWAGQEIQYGDSVPAPVLSAAIDYNGSQNTTGTPVNGVATPPYAYRFGNDGDLSHPSCVIRNNRLICLSTMPDKFAAAVVVGAGTYHVRIEDNEITGWSFAVSARSFSGFKRVLFTRNRCIDIGRLISKLLPGGSEGVHFGDHTFIIYPTQIGWYKCNFYTQTVGEAEVTIEVPRLMDYGDVTGTVPRAAQYTKLIIGFANQYADVDPVYESSINQLHHSATVTPVVNKLRISDGPALAFYINHIATRAKLSFHGGGGSGAAGFATLVNGSVQSVTITSGGSGYTSDPTVLVNTWDTYMRGSGAAFTVTRSGNAVSSVAVTNGGSGYASPVYIRWKCSEEPFILAYCPYEIVYTASTPSGSELTLRPGQQAVLIKNGTMRGNGTPLLGGAAPTTAPSFIGQQYINTNSGIAYIAKGTSFASDWAALY